MPKPTYLAVLHGPEGCDYSIGCGYDVRTLAATNLDGAVLEATTFAAEGWNDEGNIESVTVYEVSKTKKVSIAAVKREAKRMGE